MPQKKKIHIGTSGWNYRHWKGTFYPEDLSQKKWLSYYMERFKTVELNNSFYRMPDKSTFENWRAAVPDDFIFSVKVYRYITHLKKLIDSDETLNTFLENAGALKEKAGPLLFQMPPSFRFNSERLISFLKKLPDSFRYTFEFRNKTWWNDEAYRILEDYNISFCQFQLAGVITPKVVTSDLVYIRLHGPTSHKYQGSYTNETLAEWADQFKKWQKDGREVYCYFDNDDSGYAAWNALVLDNMVNGKQKALKAG